VQLFRVPATYCCSKQNLVLVETEVVDMPLPLEEPEPEDEPDEEPEPDDEEPDEELDEEPDDFTDRYMLTDL
jgi:hypothetical protein